MTIAVTSETADQYLLTARSIRISSGTVTIKENLRISHKRELSTPLVSYAKGILWTGLGLGIFGAGVFEAVKYKKASDDSYAKYNDTKDPSEAKKYREQTKSNDNLETASGLVAGLGLCVSLYGYTRFGEDQTENSYYRLEQTSASRAPAMNLRALVSVDHATLVLTLDL